MRQLATLQLQAGHTERRMLAISSFYSVQAPSAGDGMAAVSMGLPFLVNPSTSDLIQQAEQRQLNLPRNTLGDSQSCDSRMSLSPVKLTMKTGHHRPPQCFGKVLGELE